MSNCSTDPILLPLSLSLRDPHTPHTHDPQIRSFVGESVSYLQGLFSPWDLPPAVFYHRNRMIAKVWEMWEIWDVWSMGPLVSPEASGESLGGVS